VLLLLHRGETTLRQGDIISARLFFERAAQEGSARGAILAAKTYDPDFLATIDVLGLWADVPLAIKWYQFASTVYGDQEARQRPSALAPRTGQ
jgi:hypothetical protein